MFWRTWRLLFGRPEKAGGVRWRSCPLSSARFISVTAWVFYSVWRSSIIAGRKEIMHASVLRSKDIHDKWKSSYRTSEYDLLKKSLTVYSMRVLQIVGGRKPERNSRHNIFIHRQVDSLRALIPDLRVIYAGLGANPLDMINLARELRHAVKNIQPEVVHAQYATMTGAVTIMNCRPIPTIVSFGGDEIYGTYVNTHSTHSWRTSLARRCSKYCAQKAAVCVGKNKAMRDILKRWGAKRVEVIPNGVNLEVFRELDQQACREQLGLQREAQYVIFSVRDHDYVKRHDLAEKAVELCRRNSSRQVELLVLDHVAPILIPLYLNAGNVLLLCSNHEGSPNIV